MFFSFSQLSIFAGPQVLRPQSDSALRISKPGLREDWESLLRADFFVPSRGVYFEEVTDGETPAIELQLAFLSLRINYLFYVGSNESGTEDLPETSALLERYISAVAKGYPQI